MDACKRGIRYCADARVVRSSGFSNANGGSDGPELR